jgi:hypothetical protein
MGRSGCDRPRRNCIIDLVSLVARKGLHYFVIFSEVLIFHRYIISLDAIFKSVRKWSVMKPRMLSRSQKIFIYNNYVMQWIKRMFLFWLSQSFCIWASHHLSAHGKLRKCQPCKHWAQFWVFFFLLSLIKSYWHWNFLVKHKVR